MATLLFFSMPLCIYAQVKFDSEGRKLNGMIRTMTEYECSFVKNNHLFPPKYDARPEVYRRVYTCDTVKRMVLISSYVDRSLLAEKVVIRYDLNGHIVVRESYTAFGRLWEKILYKYDVSGREVEMADTTSFGGLRYCSDDTTGNLMEIKNPIWLVITHKYDEKGLVLEEREESSANIIYAHNYKYDSRGNVIETGYYTNCCADLYTDSYDTGGKIFSEKKTFRYDILNRLLESNDYLIAPVSDTQIERHSKLLVGVRDLYSTDDSGNTHCQSFNIYKQRDGTESLQKIEKKDRGCSCSNNAEKDYVLQSDKHYVLQSDKHGNPLRLTRGAKTIVREIEYFD